MLFISRCIKNRRMAEVGRDCSLFLLLNKGQLP